MYKCALRCSLRDIALPSAYHLSVVVVCWRQEVRYGKRETARSAGSEAQAALCANSGTEGKRTDAGPQRRYAPQSTYWRRDAQDGKLDEMPEGRLTQLLDKHLDAERDRKLFGLEPKQQTQP